MLHSTVKGDRRRSSARVTRTHSLECPSSLKAHGEPHTFVATGSHPSSDRWEPVRSRAWASVSLARPAGDLRCREPARADDPSAADSSPLARGALPMAQPGHARTAEPPVPGCFGRGSKARRKAGLDCPQRCAARAFRVGSGRGNLPKCDRSRRLDRPSLPGVGDPAGKLLSRSAHHALGGHTARSLSLLSFGGSSRRCTARAECSRRCLRVLELWTDPRVQGLRRPSGRVPTGAPPEQVAHRRWRVPIRRQARCATD